MYFDVGDVRKPLPENAIVRTSDRNYVIDKYVANGGFALMYIAHIEGMSKYVALKELFPRRAEQGVVQRGDDGRIVLNDPITGYTQALSERRDFLQYLIHEAKMTKRAAEVYDASGRVVAQNNPDVLGVSGPFQDELGNYYLAVDTANGHSLASFIEEGFVRDDEERIVSNGNIGEILQILLETTVLLSHLHTVNHILHLDLSPSNIYLTRNSAGTKLTPHIIDYGSAFDRTASVNEDATHYFTCNPYSPPEVQALSEINDMASGYEIDESSDTYSVVSMLFYAVTGEIYSPQMRYNRSWVKRIFREYAFEGFENATLDDAKLVGAFAARLVEIIDKGLRANQNMRFKTAKELSNALQSLVREFKLSGNLLNHIEKDELMTYALFEKFPMYDYFANDNNMHLLLFGSGEFVFKTILTAISVGQMNYYDDKRDYHDLHIHIVSKESEDIIKKRLLRQAPLLEEYSNISKLVAEKNYVSFTFDQESDVTSEAAIDRIVEKYGYARYVVISLGETDDNIRVAHSFATKLLNTGAASKHTLITYYVPENVASEQNGVASATEDDSIISLVPFNSNLASYASAIHTLGKRTLRLSYLYNKLDNPNVSIMSVVPGYLNDEYGQRSSCAAALHLKYKLASVGINPAPSTNTKYIIAAYLKSLSSEERGRLLYLEHRRWMMYMIADGFRLPSLETIQKYAFRRLEGRFINAFKFVEKKFHHCLVPSSTAGICLPIAHKEWDKYSSIDEIKATEYDDLDKMSLIVHFLAKKRVVESGDIPINEFESTVGRELTNSLSILNDLGGGNSGEESGYILASLQEKYDSVKKHLSEFTQSKSLPQDKELRAIKTELAELGEAFALAGIDISDGYKRVLEDLEIYHEFASYKDYKAPDAVIVDNLLWLIYANEDVLLVKLNGRRIADNIAGPLIMEPSSIIYYGLEQDNNIKKFLEMHGIFGNVEFMPSKSAKWEDVLDDLQLLHKSHSGKFVIDITGGDELQITAAVILATRDKTVAIVRCDEQAEKIENIMNYTKAGVYRLNTSITASDVFALYGAKECVDAKDSKRYMERINYITEDLWSLYVDFKNDWEMITAFFYARGRGTPEVFFRFNRSSVATAEWRKYSTVISSQMWKAQNLDECFKKMEAIGFIRNLETSPMSSMVLAVSFSYMGNAPEQRNDYVYKSLNLFFGKKICYALKPFQFNTYEENENTVRVALDSGSSVDVYDRDGVDFADKRPQKEGTGKRFLYSEVVPALRRLEQIGLIYDLNTGEDISVPPAKIKFAYRDLAVKDCLAVAGNVLELYAWNAAQQTGYFDDCRPNFSFSWGEGVSNEIDLILTKGLTSLVVSCKTAKFKKDHLNEIMDMTDRFSINSKAVIVYSSSMAVDDNNHLTTDIEPIKNRASSMGVFLIDLNHIGDNSLGDIFVGIAEGKISPKELFDSGM